MSTAKTPGAWLGRLRWRVLAACCAGLLLWHAPALAQQAELDALDAVQTLDLQDRARARAALQAQGPAWLASPHQAVRRTYLTTLINQLLEAGQVDQAQAATDRLMALSDNANDDIGRLIAHTANAHRLGVQGQHSEALRLLERIEPVALRSNDAEALWMFHLVRGNLQNTTGQFEPALGNILKSMDFAMQRPRQAQASRLRSLIYLGLIYWSMKNGAFSRCRMNWMSAVLGWWFMLF